MKQEENKFKLPALFGALFALGGVVLAVLLICKHTFPELCSSSMGCTIKGGVDGCSALGKSSFSKILGVPIAIPGLFYYLFMGLLFFSLSGEKDSGKQKGMITLLLSLLVFGFIFDLTLAVINFAVLENPCMLCAYSYIAMLGMFAMGILIFLKNEREIGGGAEFGVGAKSSIFNIAIAVIATVCVPVALMIFDGRRLNSGGNAGGHEGHNHNGGGHKQEYVVDLLPKKDVAERLEALRGRKKTGLNVRGLTNIEGKGYIEIHKFADFRCGHCYHASKILERAIKRWPGRVKIFYRHFPLDGTCNNQVQRAQPGGLSCNSAQASLCAPQQGIFVKMYHSMFEFQATQTMATPETLKRLTEKLGGDWSKMLACMGSSATSRALNRDLRDAKRIKVESTPTIILQDRLLDPGTPNIIFFLNTLDALVYEKEGDKAYEEFKARNKTLKKQAGHQH